MDSSFSSPKINRKTRYERQSDVQSEDLCNGILNEPYCKNMFVEIKPDLLVNKMNILWVQKYGECIYLSQNDKIHEVCNTSKKEDMLFNKVNDIFFHTNKQKTKSK